MDLTSLGRKYLRYRVSAIWRRFKDLGIPSQKYSDVTDQELDGIVLDVQRNIPNIGISMLQGYVSSRGITVQRNRVRESVLRLNPNRALTRWQQVISRRTYSVSGPNALWHIDGHHSLIRWRLVIHGSIDGFSRMVTFLSGSTNNKAEAVFQLFKRATNEFGIPSRVRSDKGGENIQVCHFMISVRGPGRRSHIAGSSVHNQRIEGLWRDVYRCVCCSLHEVFYYLEAQGVLDPTNDSDLFVLRCVFVPVLNNLLSMFARAWNHHPVRTERNWSPHKMWINAMIYPHRRNQMAVQDVLGNDVSSLDYGIDDSGPLPDQQTHTVDVPETLRPLSRSVHQSFLGNLQNVVNINEAVIEYFHARDHFHELLDANYSSLSSSFSHACILYLFIKIN